MIFLYLSHKGMEIFYEPFTNRSYFNYISTTPVSYLFRCIYIYTDVFLMLSGFLVTYVTLGRLKKGRVVSIKSEMVGRYVRIMPATAAVILFSSYVLPAISSGPLWNLVTEEADLCKRNGWRNFLMIQNWMGIENICRPQTHHMATDFTLLGFSLVLVTLLMKKHMKLGVVLVVLMATISTIGRFYVTLRYELGVFVYLSIK
jgi:peptidoglycan/LPS O-acetylase OafA/YrhL